MIRLAVPASQLARREAYRSLAGDIPLCFLAGLLGNDRVFAVGGVGAQFGSFLPGD